MIAFHNDINIKNKYLDRVISHQLADEIIKGKYWENGKGCAVGCTIHGSDHSKYESELGIPQLLARLEDGIFEGLPNDRAKSWPKEFLDAIKVGSNLSGVWPQFAVWLLTDAEHGVIKYAKTDKNKKVIQDVSDCYSRYSEITSKEWQTVRNAAYDAADAAYDAAVYDAAAYAAYAAYAAVYDAAVYDAAVYDAYAADAADAADAAYDADDYARKKMRVAQADKLLELLRDCK